MKFEFFIFLFLSIALSPVKAIEKSKTKQAEKKSERSLSNSSLPSIYSKHWYGTLPTIDKDLLLIHNIFIISFDLEKKFPTWVAYQLSPSFVWGHLKLKRKYILDPFLSPKESLSFKDYTGASHCDKTKGIGYDKGHLAPLGSFKGSVYAHQAQYLSNIVPQTKNLNQGPWRKLEEQVRAFVKKGHKVKILTGPIYGKEGEDKVAPCWKAVQKKLKELPLAYWKIISFKHKDQIKICSFLMPQKIKDKKTSPRKYQISLEQLEKSLEFNIFQNTKVPLETQCDFLF